MAHRIFYHFRVILIGSMFAVGMAPTAFGQSVAQINQAQVSRSAEVKWLGLPIYRAAVLTQGGMRFDWQKPFALELTYLRSFSKSRLLKATGKELERMEGARADHQRVLTKLQTCFRDVSKGDRFLAVGLKPNKVNFLFNDAQTCSIEDPDIRRRFLGIWLSDQSRNPKISQYLRGESDAY